MTPRWLHRWSPRPDAAVLLAMLPHAGGAAAAYRQWASAVPDWIEVAGVELPGRGARRGEAAAGEAAEIAGPLAEALAGEPGRPLVLFGHSMGALLAYETARALRDRTGAPPAALVVSGYDAPWSPAPGRRLLPDPADPRLLARLARFGGVPDAVLRDRALAELLLVSLRADLEMLRGYRVRPEPPLGCPVRAYRGADDPLTTAAGADAWRRESPDFAGRRFPGGHFFAHESPGAVATVLAGDIAGAVGAVIAGHDPTRSSWSGPDPCETRR